MNWVKKQKLPVMEAIKFNGHPCNKSNNLWQVLYQSYNSAQNRPINTQLFDEISTSQLAK